jgi:alpha-tubulin suppressor-like RCC1 family protein
VCWRAAASDERLIDSHPGSGGGYLHLDRQRARRLPAVGGTCSTVALGADGYYVCGVGLAQPLTGDSFDDEQRFSFVPTARAGYPVHSVGEQALVDMHGRGAAVQRIDARTGEQDFSGDLKLARTDSIASVKAVAQGTLMLTRRHPTGSKHALLLKHDGSLHKLAHESALAAVPWGDSFATVSQASGPSLSVRIGDAQRASVVDGVSLRCDVGTAKVVTATKRQLSRACEIAVCWRITVGGLFMTFRFETIIAIAVLVTSCGSSSRPTVVDPRGVRLLAAHASSNQTCVVMHNGELWCWGVAAYADIHRTGEPVRVGQARTATELSVAHGSVCVLDDAGAVSCAGSNERGQLGDGSDGHPELRSVDALPPVTQLARSSDANCALARDGVVWCWGVESTGSAGLLPVWSRVRVAPTRMILPERVVSIRATIGSVCAAAESGATFCSRALVGPGWLEWRSIDALPRRGELVVGEYRACRRDGDVLTCSDITESSSGVSRFSVPTALSQVQVIRDGLFAIADNKLYFQGLHDRDARTPNGAPAQDRALRSFSQATLGSAQRFVLGAMHACALDADDHVWCWGDDSRGQMARGTALTVVAPARVEGASGVADMFRFYAGDTSGVAYVTANSTRAVIAVTPPYEQATSSDAPPFAASSASTVELASWASSHRYVAHSGGAALTLSDRGELVTHTWTMNVGTPRFFENVAPRYGLRQVVTGSNGACRLTETYDVQCVQPGSPSTPIAYPQLQGSTSITANLARVCGVLPSRSVRCVGLSPLGAPPTSDVETGEDLATLTDVRALFSGDAATCAVSGEGAVHCWGLHSGHLLGRSSNDHVVGPTRVEGIDNARSVVIDHDHACANTADGRALCWGSNFLAQCGAPPSPMVYPPVEVQNIRDARAVFTTLAHGCATRADGSLWCWGQRFSNYSDLGAIARARDPMRVQLP